MGKSTTSCASAIAFAEHANQKTLLITTDPASSLGDVLGLSYDEGDREGGVVERGKYRTVRKVEGVGGGGLWVAEIDVKGVTEELRRVLKGSTSGSESGGGGVGGMLEGWADVLKEVPPGFDEVLALSQLVEMVEQEDGVSQGEENGGGGGSGSGGFDKVVIDTAPTGHTVRLLTLPDFIDNMLETALRFRREIGAVTSLLQMRTSMKDAEEKIQGWKERVARVGDMLNDPTSTEFVLVSVATKLAVAETKRLRNELAETGVYARYVVANRILSEDVKDGRHPVLDEVAKRHRNMISSIDEKFPKLRVTRVPLWDSEIKGKYGLLAFAPIVFKRPENETSSQEHQDTGKQFFEGVFDHKSSGKSKIVFVGGKGGVGKTTTAAAMGAELAVSGFKTLVLSTDPAHSLGDCVDMELEPGKVEEISLGMPDGASGSLSVLEVDARGEVDRVLRKRVEGVPGLEGVLDTLPPGVDEVVALGKVVEAMGETGGYDRVVVDTAPTGHTLRLLSLPVFLDGLLGKLARMVARGALGGVFDTVRTVMGKGFQDKKESSTEKWQDQLERVRKRIQEVKKIVEDKERSQFVVVTIPTEVAMAETERLIETLKDGKIQVGNLIVNQVINESYEGAAYARRIRTAQLKCVESLRQLDDVTVVEIPWFDKEVRGVHGLRVVSNMLIPTEAAAQ